MTSARPTTNPSASRLLLFLGRRGYRRMFRILSVGLGCDLPCRDYGDLFLPHPYSIVVHARTVLGEGCTIYQGVTIGTADGKDVSATIGDAVIIGAGAVILGNVSIGEGAQIGANSVVLSDVPQGATAVGAPAVIVRRRP